MAKKMKTTISAIVLVGGNYNKRLLEICLKSLSWCDETIKVETSNLTGGFADWRNEGAKKAKGEWLLYVDSDEEVTDGLKHEIESVINNLQTDSAYAIPRRNIVLRREMRHCGLWPDYVLRLIKKAKLIGWEGKLHEQPKITGKIGYLHEPFIHNKHDNLADMVDKTNKWSEVEAKLMFEAHHPPMTIVRFLSAGFREFWLRMIIQTAFMDGMEGTIYGLYQVYSRLISYSKLWEMQLNHARRNS
jgi:glycosyltransferase involved in cell wall biosynthesis